MKNEKRARTISLRLLLKCRLEDTLKFMCSSFMCVWICDYLQLGYVQSVRVLSCVRAGVAVRRVAKGVLRVDI